MTSKQLAQILAIDLSIESLNNYIKENERLISIQIQYNRPTNRYSKYTKAGKLALIIKTNK